MNYWAIFRIRLTTGRINTPKCRPKIHILTMNLKNMSNWFQSKIKQCKMLKTTSSKLRISRKPLKSLNKKRMPWVISKVLVLKLKKNLTMFLKKKSKFRKNLIHIRLKITPQLDNLAKSSGFRMKDKAFSRKKSKSYRVRLMC